MSLKRPLDRLRCVPRAYLHLPFFFRQRNGRFFTANHNVWSVDPFSFWKRVCCFQFHPVIDHPSRTMVPANALNGFFQIKTVAGIMRDYDAILHWSDINNEDDWLEWLSFEHESSVDGERRKSRSYSCIFVDMWQSLLGKQGRTSINRNVRQLIVFWFSPALHRYLFIYI